MQDATTAIRCLTRLAQSTGWSLLVQLWPTALRIARLVARFRENPVSPETFAAFERDLNVLLLKVGRFIVQWMLNSIEPETRADMPPAVFWEGFAFRPKRLSPFRNLNCLFGPIRVRRWLYEALDGVRAPAFFPLEHALGIVAGVATPALADLAARLSAEFTQRQVLEWLRQQNQVAWGPQTLRKVARAMADGIAPHQHAARVETILGWLKQAADRSGPVRFTLAVGRDGLMLPVRGQETYKEGATATVSVFDRWGQRLGTVYLATMPESGQRTLSDELTQLLRDVLTQWPGTMPRLVYVTDAGFHPRDYFDNVLRCMVNPHRPLEYLPWEWTVDYYHACGYISQLAESIFGPGREAHAWAAKMRRWLKEKPGGVYRVLRSAGALRKIRGLAGSEKDYHDAYGFLRRHARRMDYASRRRLRLPIGSGVTEAACKTVFTQRFKSSGMKWNLEGGAVVLALRVAVLSQTWARVRTAMFRSYQSVPPRTPAGNRPDPLAIAA